MYKEYVSREIITLPHCDRSASQRSVARSPLFQLCTTYQKIGNSTLLEKSNVNRHQTLYLKGF